MPDLVIRSIDALVTMGGGSGLGVVNEAAVAMEGGRVSWVGPDAQAPSAAFEVDGTGCIGLPGLVDCHTHTVFAGSRASEFRDRLGGRSYTEILEEGGGILRTVRATREATEDSLARVAAQRLAAMAAGGVTTVEVKSGYGLTASDEAKMLRAARRAGDDSGVRVLTTFLGAHTVPAELRGNREAYVRDVIDAQLPSVASHADFIDAYVDRGAFTVDEGRRILAAGKKAGLGVRVHAEQVAHTGAAQMAAELGALSADHLERLDEAGAEAMARAGTVAVLLPGAMTYLRDTPPPVAVLRAHGVPMAVATDFNPGSSPVRDLWSCATLACLSMGLTVEEALRGITRVAADALGRPDLGRVAVGAAGDLVLMRPPPGEPCDPAVLVQYLGSHEPALVIRDGALRG